MILESRRKADAYTDALWEGRLAAAEQMKGFFTERLATAARLSTLLQHLHNAGEVRELIQRERSLFPKSVLATEGGRLARSAFNLLAGAASQLYEYRTPQGSIPTGAETLVNERLSSITFVQDYIQFEFNGQGLQALCPITIHDGHSLIQTDDPTFRNALCALINRTVSAIAIEDVAVKVSFDRVHIEFQVDPQTPLIFRNRDKHDTYFGGC